MDNQPEGLEEVCKDFFFASPVIKDLVLASSINTFTAAGPHPSPTASATSENEAITGARAARIEICIFRIFMVSSRCVSVLQNSRDGRRGAKA